MICLPTETVAKFIKALKDGTLQPDELAKVSSANRREVIGKVVGEENAAEVNALFERKLQLRDFQQGAIKWATEVMGKKPAIARDIISKVNNMKDLLSPEDEKSFKSDLVAKKLGAQVTTEEAQKITNLANKAAELKDKNPTMAGVSDEYLQARNDLSNYVSSLKSTSLFKSIARNLAIIARNNLLLNPATPIKTAIGEIENTAMDFITRRIGALSKGGLNPDIAKEAHSEAWTTFRKTGDNTAGMESLDDTHLLGKGESFIVPKASADATGIIKGTESAIRNVAKVSNKIAIDYEHQGPFVVFYQKAFFDMADVASSQMAKAEGLSGDAAKARAAEILKDAVKIQPETAEGKQARLISQQQAARITSTNDTWASRLALGTKRAINEAVPGLGDFIMPIAKIPANIIANALDNAGVGLPKGVIDIWQGAEKMKSDDVGTQYEGANQMSAGIQRVARIVGTTAVAALIASKLQPKDFRSDNYGNHFVNIGGVWINMEYLSIASPALAGFIMAKENPGSIPEETTQYLKGVGGSLIAIPGVVGELPTVATQGVAQYTTAFLQSRLTPAIWSSLTGGQPLTQMLFGKTGVQSDASYTAEKKAKAKASAEKAAATRKKNRALGI